MVQRKSVVPPDYLPLSCRFAMEFVEDVSDLRDFLGNTAVMRKAPQFRRDPYLIGVAGGTASGKTTVCQEIISLLGDTNKRVVIISQDSFYRNLTDNELKLAKEGNYNFDHPNAFDDKLFKEVLLELKEGRPTKIPHYDFVTHSRIPGKEEIIDNADVVLIEGILVFYDPEIRSLFDMRLFVDTDSDIRLARRVQRDLEERGRNIAQVLHQYTTFVKPAFDEFCFQTKKFADLIIPRGAENIIAIELLVQRIQEILRTPRSSSTSSLASNSSEKLNGEENNKPTRFAAGDCQTNGFVRPH
uniref:Uridine kinase n=1 Tax=Panagrellus redivivus TaxID=6233 RepID=A0A7E4ZRA0_PANRE